MFSGSAFRYAMPMTSTGMRALPVGLRGFSTDPTKSSETKETKESDIPKADAKETKKTAEAAAEPKKEEPVVEEPVDTKPAEESKMIEIDESVLTQKDAEVREFKEKYLRSLAEIDNVRRRTQLDISNFKKYAVSKFASDLLVISDNLGLALKNLETSGHLELMNNDNDEARALKSLYDGLLITNKGMKHTFESHNIKQIESEGKKFDPNFHEVIFEVPDATKEAGTIVTVVKDGYTLHDRVLRAAQVGTVKAQ